jgi:hypothetical protein
MAPRLSPERHVDRSLAELVGKDIDNIGQYNSIREKIYNLGNVGTEGIDQGQIEASLDDLKSRYPALHEGAVNDAKRILKSCEADITELNAFHKKNPGIDVEENVIYILSKKRIGQLQLLYPEIVGQTRDKLGFDHEPLE